MGNLNIPPKYRRAGLYVFCNNCKRYSRIKDGRLHKHVDCSHPAEKQVFKLRVHVRGTKNKCKTLVLRTRDLQEADKKRIEFIELLTKNNFNLNVVFMTDKSDSNRFLLTYQMERYIKYITNGGFHSFEAPKELDISTINDYKRNFRYFLESLTDQVDIRKLRIDKVCEEHADIFHRYLIKKQYSRKSYNNIMASLRSFYNHLIDYEEFDIRNPFRKVPILAVHYNPITYSKEEFEKILSVVSKENGYDKKTKRNWHRIWLPTAFKIAIYTNLRLDELANLKFSDIFKEDGVWFLKVDNIKVNALLRITDDSVKRSMVIPVIPELYKVLTEECDFEHNKGLDVCVFEPESSRRTVYSAIGKGFSHYKRIAKIDDRKSFKELRTTFTTGLAVKYGEKFASLVTDHSSKDVVNKHYVDKIARAKAMRDFSPFGIDESEKNPKNV